MRGREEGVDIWMKDNAMEGAEGLDVRYGDERERKGMEYKGRWMDEQHGRNWKGMYVGMRAGGNVLQRNACRGRTCEGGNEM